MEIKNSKNWVKFSREQALLGSVLVLALAFAVRYVLHPYIEPFAVFHFFIVACLSIQYFYGYQFAIFGILISVLLGEYFFVKPYGTFDALSSKDLIISLNFATVTLIAVAFMESLRRSVYARGLMLKVMASRHKISLQRENDRIFYAKKTNEAWSILEELLTDFEQIILLKFGDADYKIEPLFYKLARNVQITDDALAWQQGIHPDDVHRLMQLLQADGPRTNGGQPFGLRFAVADGEWVESSVEADRFSFMGKQLVILRLAQAN